MQMIIVLIYPEQPGCSTGASPGIPDHRHDCWSHSTPAPISYGSQRPTQQRVTHRTTGNQVDHRLRKISMFLLEQRKTATCLPTQLKTFAEMGLLG